MGQKSKKQQGYDGTGSAATLGDIAGLVVGCLVGPVGRRFLPFKAVLRTRGSLPRSTLYMTEEGYRLGGWVVKQRSTRDSMEPDRRQQLESLPGWSWRPYSDQWERSFAYIKEFAERDGNAKSLKATRPTTASSSVNGFQFREGTRTK